MNLLASPPRSGWNFIASVRNLFLITVTACLDGVIISTVSPIIFNASSSLPPGRGFGSRTRLRLLLRRQLTAAQLLGKAVIAQGHMLLNACRTSFDAAVAESAHTEALARGLKSEDRIVSYV